VLKAIKMVLGPKLPLQLFFDLIVGNGYVIQIPKRYGALQAKLTP
jgi:hypothetical protein